MTAGVSVGRRASRCKSGLPLDRPPTWAAFVLLRAVGLLVQVVDGVQIRILYVGLHTASPPDSGQRFLSIYAL